VHIREAAEHPAKAVDSLVKLVKLVGTLVAPAADTLGMGPLSAFEHKEQEVEALLVSNLLHQERGLQVCQLLHLPVSHNLGRNACFQERMSRSLSRNG
jgi:hypothetical protein